MSGASEGENPRKMQRKCKKMQKNAKKMQKNAKKNTMFLQFSRFPRPTRLGPPKSMHFLCIFLHSGFAFFLHSFCLRFAPAQACAGEGLAEPPVALASSPAPACRDPVTSPDLTRPEAPDRLHNSSHLYSPGDAPAKNPMNPMHRLNFNFYLKLTQATRLPLLLSLLVAFNCARCSR